MAEVRRAPAAADDPPPRGKSNKVTLPWEEAGPAASEAHAAALPPTLLAAAEWCVAVNERAQQWIAEQPGVRDTSGTRQLIADVIGATLSMETIRVATHHYQVNPTTHPAVWEALDVPEPSDPVDKALYDVLLAVPAPALKPTPVPPPRTEDAAAAASPARAAEAARAAGVTRVASTAPAAGAARAAGAVPGASQAADDPDTIPDAGDHRVSLSELQLQLSQAYTTLTALTVAVKEARAQAEPGVEPALALLEGQCGIAYREVQRIKRRYKRHANRDTNERIVGVHRDALRGNDGHRR